MGESDRCCPGKDCSCRPGVLGGRQNYHTGLTERACGPEQTKPTDLIAVPEVEAGRSLASIVLGHIPWKDWVAVSRGPGRGSEQAGEAEQEFGQCMDLTAEGASSGPFAVGDHGRKRRALVLRQACRAWGVSRRR